MNLFDLYKKQKMPNLLSKALQAVSLLVNPPQLYKDQVGGAAIEFGQNIHWFFNV